MYYYKCIIIILFYCPFLFDLFGGVSLKCLFHQRFSVLAHDLFFHDVSLEFLGSAYLNYSVFRIHVHNLEYENI